MANEFGTTKSVFILTIVAGCFAILWPNVFYPMVHGDYYDSKVEAEGNEHMKPERPAHLHPDMLHPALREKGRAIQQAKKASVEIKAGSPSLPGMRPTLGGAGHIVPPPKGGTTMGIVMPMYTIGIVVFFMYTLLRLMFKKGGEDQECEELTCDADFQHDDTPDELKEESENVNEPAIGSCNDCDAIANVETSPEAQIVQEEESAPTEEEVVDTKAGVKVIGMETTETCEEGKWCRPETPRSSTPQNIYLPAVLPDQSKIIVTNSSTETIASLQDNAPVVLSGKVTLSLIGLQDVSVSDDVDSYHEATMKMTTECLSGTVPNVHSGKTKDQPKIDDIEDKIIVNNG